MKKLIIIVGLVTGLVTSSDVKAQAPIQQKTTAFGSHLDTVDNTEAHVTIPYRVDTWKNGITAQVVVKKISGTVGGTLALEGSMDGTEWNLIGSATTPSDASANYSFNTTVRWYYYRVRYTGTGTMSASVRTTTQLY
jgi:hypothetical protein